jgi:hypothetical protein
MNEAYKTPATSIETGGGAAIDPHAIVSNPAETPNYGALMSAGQRADMARLSGAHDLNSAISRMLATPDGAQFWAWLTSFTLQRPTYDHTKPAADAASHGLFREGQNAIAYAILEMANRGRKAAPHPQTKD